MSILCTIYFPIKFECVLIHYTDDGSLYLGSKMSGLVMVMSN